MLRPDPQERIVDESSIPEPQAEQPPSEEAQGRSAQLPIMVWLAGVFGLALSNLLLAPLASAASLRAIQQFAAGALIVVGLTQLANSWRRVYEGHWRIDGLRWLLGLEFSMLGGVPLTVGLCVVLSEPSLALACVFTLVVTVAFLVTELLEAEIAESIASANKRSVAAFAGSLRWPARLIFRDKEGRTLRQVLERPGKGYVPRAGLWLLHAPHGEMSHMRKLMAALLAVAAFGLVETPLAEMFDAADGPEQEQVEPEPAARGPADTPKPRAPADRRAGPRQPVPADGGESPAEPQDWDRECLTDPGDGADDPWARAVLHALYLGFPDGGTLPHANDPPGARAGCTGVVNEVTRDGATLYYTIATEPRTARVMSVAVVSRRWRWALFIAPAAKVVQRLIREYGLVGGTPRHEVGTGDLYLVRVAVGTTVLVRAEVQQSDPPYHAEPYVELPPPASEAWLDCMHERGTWLWPIARREPDGTITFTLVSDVVAQDDPLIVHFDPQRKVAWRATRNTTRIYALRGHQLDEDEVLEQAALVR
jgi:hypothetical protein